MQTRTDEKILKHFSEMTDEEFMTSLREHGISVFKMTPEEQEFEEAKFENPDILLADSKLSPISRETNDDSASMGMIQCEICGSIDGISPCNGCTLMINEYRIKAWNQALNELAKLCKDGEVSSMSKCLYIKEK